MAGIPNPVGMVVATPDPEKPLQMMPIDPLPAPGPGEALLQVDVAGLCHSDLHILDGVKAYKNFKPFALCHEIGGTVVAVGTGVTNVEVGKQYVLYPWLGCGKCMQCQDSNNEIFCMPGFDATGKKLAAPNQGRVFGVAPGQNGGFASHLIVPDSKYLVDAGNVPFPLAATYTCSGLTTYSAVKKAKLAMQGKTWLTPRHYLLIIGAGGLGSHAISWAKAICDCTIVVAENDVSKHANAKEMGADIVLDTSDPAKAEALIQEATQGGPHSVIDLVGMPATSRMGRRVLRKGGTQIQVGLFGGDNPWGNVASFATDHKHLLGNFVGSFDEFVEMMDYVRAGKKKDIPYETRPIEQLNEAIDDLKKGKIVGRCVLLHNHSKAKM